MDRIRFDTLARRLATSQSRRVALRGPIGGGEFLVISRSRPENIAADSVSICHVDEDTGAYKVIIVGAPTVAAHMAHGDLPVTSCRDHDSDCDDSNECTIDTCVNGVCQHTPDGSNV